MSLIDQKFTLEITFGIMEIQDQWRPVEGGGLGSFSRKRNVVDGIAGPWSDWEATGVVMFWPDPQPTFSWRNLWGLLGR